ncbi:MAG TPA: low temperature requirement protein A [Acidimicrobiia bacterium]|nr:low temperature requirement protein A [Acidimicrobiia bacterium]
MAKRSLHAPEAQSVTFVELFFDLVFVFAVTQVTVLTAGDLTVEGVARSLLLFWLIWWAWTQFTWTLNPADTSHTAVRALTLLGTAIAFVMAASVTRAFGDEAAWFAVPYVLVRVVGLGLQVRIDLERADLRNRAISVWAGLSGIGLALVLVGALVDTPGRYWIWLGAIVADLVAAGMAGGRQEWDLDTEHFSERHGLFVIIALGESLIVAATAVSVDERTGSLVAVTAAALAVACLLWWTYFAWVKDAIEEGFASTPPEVLGATARDAFSLGHFPLVCGIIGFAIAIEEIVHHPSDVPSGEVTAALGAGVTLYVVAAAFSLWRTSRVILWPRLGILGLTVAGLAIVSTADAVWQLGVVAVGLAIIALVEARAPCIDVSNPLSERVADAKS